MSRSVVLVGHCGPDASYLRMAVSNAVKGTSVVTADDDATLRRVIQEGATLLLVNRQLDWGFRTDEGIELIRLLKQEFPGVKAMLVSNYPEAQEAAVQAGALPGFGKRELGTPRVKQLLRDAVGEEETTGETRR